MRIDHVIYGTADLDAAAARLHTGHGLTAVAGGRHDGLGTHNRIVPLGEGTFLELLAIADADEAKRSALGTALLAALESGDALFGWAVAVEDLRPVAARLGTSMSTVGRQGMTAYLTGVAESLAEPCLPFFIQRSEGRPPSVMSRTTSSIGWIEVAGDPGPHHALAGRRGPARAARRRAAQRASHRPRGPRATDALRARFAETRATARPSSATRTATRSSSTTATCPRPSCSVATASAADGRPGSARRPLQR